MRLPTRPNILDAARHCRLAHVRQSSQAPPILTDNKAATDLVVLTATKPLTAPPTSIGFGRPPLLGEPILPTAGPRGGAGCSGLSRAPEGRPRMPEPRPDPVLGLSLVEALRGLPEAPPGSFQAARAPV